MAKVKKKPAPKPATRETAPKYVPPKYVSIPWAMAEKLELVMMTDLAEDEFIWDYLFNTKREPFTHADRTTLLFAMNDVRTAGRPDPARRES